MDYGITPYKKRTLAFQFADEFGRSDVWRCINQKMYMVRHSVYPIYITALFVQDMEQDFIDTSLAVVTDCHSALFGGYYDVI